VARRIVGRYRIEFMARLSPATTCGHGSELGAVAKRLADAIEELDKAGFLLAAAHAETALWVFLDAWSRQSDAGFNQIPVRE